MLRERFDRELQRLQDETLMLGSQVEENLVRSVQALISRDMAVSQELIAADTAVNQRRIQLGQDALRLIATQSPMAGDMRFIASVIEIAGELERIHDYIKGIAKINLMVGEKPIPAVLTRLLPEMAKITAGMLRDALAAFGARDADAARQIPQQDDMVDSLFNETYVNIVNYVVAESSAMDLANRVEWAAHNLERAADRVINICEWTVYVVTGHYQEVSSEFEAPPVIDPEE